MEKPHKARRRVKNVWLLLMLASYRNLLVKRPLLTRSVVTGTLLGGGDLIAQLLERWQERSTRQQIDWSRAGRVGALGLVVTGPLFYYFYGALDRLLPGKTPLVVASKVAIDQLGFSPFTIGGYLAFVRLANGESLAELREHWWSLYWPMLRTNYTIWPAAQAINFAFIAAEHRVLYISSVAMLWNVYLSRAANSETTHETTHEATRSSAMKSQT